MSNKTRKWRSAIAMVLVISMLFSIFPVAAFAEDNMNSEPKEYIKYVSLGDSMTNGYGLEGYEYEYHGNDKTAECAEESIFGEATNAPAACSEPDENHKVLHWANGYLQESPE
ncbi:MAG: hypothetical protein IJD56_01090, partial [Peptococcaceae bacterium]|nr:hypothetical protein [Peptococcaceae bacterium]